MKKTREVAEKLYENLSQNEIDKIKSDKKTKEKEQKINNQLAKKRER